MIINKKVFDLNLTQLLNFNLDNINDWHELEGFWIRNLSQDRELVEKVVKYSKNNLDKLIEESGYQCLPLGPKHVKIYLFAELTRCEGNASGSIYFATEILPKYWTIFIRVVYRLSNATNNSGTGDDKEGKNDIYGSRGFSSS